MQAEPIIPQNVARFEALLYASLLIDVLSAAFLMERPVDAGGRVMFGLALFVTGFFLGIMHLIRLAARQAKDWARWALAVLYLLSAASFMTSMKRNGLDLRNFFDLVSLALTASGFYYAFTGDAAGWFSGSARNRRG